MVRGRPRVEVAPCRFCRKQFKRFEHLLRHERTREFSWVVWNSFETPLTAQDTREKPYVCSCQKKFTRQDLLARHVRIAHAGNEELQSLSLSDPTQVVRNRNVGRDVAEKQNCFTIASQSDAGSSGVSKFDIAGPRPIESPERQDETDNDSPDTLQAPASASTVVETSVNFHSVDHVLDIPVGGPTMPPSEDDNREDCVNWSPAGEAFALSGDDRAAWDEMNLQADFLSASFLDTNFPLLNILPCQPATYSGQEDSFINPAQRASEHAEMDDSGTIASFAQSIRLDGQPLLGIANSPDAFKAAEPALSIASTLALATYEHISYSIQLYSSSLPRDFSMPSRYRFSRYLEGYFCSFHEALPFIHKPTVSLSDLAPELILAMAAVGALYTYEHSTGYRLWNAAYDLAKGQLRARGTQPVSRFAKPTSDLTYAAENLVLYPPENPMFPWPGENTQSSPDRDSNLAANLQTLQALLVLMNMASWSAEAIAKESMSIAGTVAMIVREVMLSVPDHGPQQHMDWTSWINIEGRRRTIFVAFIMSNVHHIAFNIPPTILSQEMQICLPSSTAEWRAGSAKEWEQVRQDLGTNERSFQAELSALLQGKHIHVQGSLPGFANHVLIHSLLQQIFLERQASGLLAYDNPTLDPRRMIKLETALRAWQYSWEASAESTLNPFSAKGPIGFNSTAILRLSYIRLSANTGPYRYLDSRDPAVISQMIVKKSNLFSVRAAHLDRAILQSIHALSIPVRLGIPYVGHTQSMNWSISHSICNLECAMLLSRWLLDVAQSVRVIGIESVRPEEQKLVRMVVSLVEETDYAVELIVNQHKPAYIDQLAVLVVKIWAEIFSGQHIHDMMHVIGSSLRMMGDVLASSITES